MSDRWTVRISNQQGIVGTTGSITEAVSNATELRKFIGDECQLYVVSPKGQLYTIPQAIELAEFESDDTVQTVTSGYEILGGAA